MEDRAEVIFVNAIEQAGFANGIYNVCFSTARFVPATDDAGTKTLAVNPYISANLRMDLFVVQQLFDSLKGVLEQQTKPAPSKSEVN
jgi:hypothetical protein